MHQPFLRFALAANRFTVSLRPLCALRRRLCTFSRPFCALRQRFCALLPSVMRFPLTVLHPSTFGYVLFKDGFMPLMNRYKHFLNRYYKIHYGLFICSHTRCYVFNLRWAVLESYARDENKSIFLKNIFVGVFFGLFAVNGDIT